MRRALLLPFTLLCPFDVPAHATERDSALKLPDVLISENREVRPRAESSSASTVFTRADIDRLQPSGIVDLLGRVPGVQVAQSGGRGSLPGIFVRGLQASQTLVLVDGVRIANATSADSNLQYLSVDQIERVEVLRGSRSVIHGADAMGGVIQIFTRRADEEGTQGRIELSTGSNQRWQRSMGVSGAHQQTRFALGASLDESRGIDRTRGSFDSDADHDAYRNRSFTLSFSHQFSEGLEAGFSAMDSQGKNEYDNPFGRFDPSTSTLVGQRPYSDFQLSNVAAFVETRPSDTWKSRLELGHSENRETSADTLSTEGSVFNTYRDSLSWQNTLRLDSANSLLAGVDLSQDRVASSTAFEQDSRWNRAVFVQHSYQGELFATQMGWRHDQNQQYGGQGTWSAAMTWFAGADDDVVLSYSEGFRAPTFNDLYYPDFSNPNLTPEHSRTYELQWRSRVGESTQLETSVYRTELRDAIVLDSDYRPQNIGAARVNGFESALRQQWLGWDSNLSLAVIDPRDRDTGHTLSRRARRTASLDLDRHFDRLGLGLTWQAVSTSYNDAANQQPIGGYALLGLRGSWQATPELVLNVKVDNLFDRQYSRTLYSFDGASYGYREEGRAWMLGFSWTPAL
jgi:vitamin B12 transporter